jgi:precorrin-6B C5,15-methyltransferase / cobalt-precorrin-6B C5,C15-methyltransferase
MIIGLNSQLITNKTQPSLRFNFVATPSVMIQDKWLSIIGIGEDGLTGLSPVAKALVDRATIIFGGSRHLAMLPENLPNCQERLVWESPIEHSVQKIKQYRSQAVCILASGDPMCYGIGVTILQQISIAEITVIPASSAYSLACARLGWSLTEVELLSLCGRDPASLNSFFTPHTRLLILSADRHTPTIVARMLTDKGYGKSQITVLERMGGEGERTIAGIANTWNTEDLDNLNTIAITCIPDTDTIPLSFVTGLPDNAYHHDGQLTKREIRSITLATLAPLPHQLLWDVGAGCGSISIEWLRSHPSCRAIAIEQNSTRRQYIADNAISLGVPRLQIVAGIAPDALQELPQPNTIFIGGGVTVPLLLETCWNALPKGGHLVVNAVTVESELKLLQWQEKYGGELIRIAIQRTEPIGKFSGWKAMSPVTQWSVLKKVE